MATDDELLKDLEERIARGEVTACWVLPEKLAEVEERQRFWNELGEEDQDSGGFEEC